MSVSKYSLSPTNQAAPSAAFANSISPLRQMRHAAVIRSNHIQSASVGGFFPIILSLCRQLSTKGRKALMLRDSEPGWPSPHLYRPTRPSGPRRSMVASFLSCCGVAFEFRLSRASRAEARTLPHPILSPSWFLNPQTVRKLVAIARTAVRRVEFSLIFLLCSLQAAKFGQRLMCCGIFARSVHFLHRHAA